MYADERLFWYTRVVTVRVKVGGANREKGIDRDKEQAPPPFPLKVGGVIASSVITVLRNASQSKA